MTTCVLTIGALVMMRLSLLAPWWNRLIRALIFLATSRPKVSPPLLLSHHTLPTGGDWRLIMAGTVTRVVSVLAGLFTTSFTKANSSGSKRLRCSLKMGVGPR